MLDPTIEISSMIINFRFDNLVLRVLSLSCVRGWEPNLEVPSRSAECRVIPWMLKAATPVGGVSNTSGSTRTERRNSLTVSLCIREMT